MDDLTRARQLIRQYFDQTATPTEREELEQLLREHREAAAAFADAARLEAWLSGLFQDEGQIRQVTEFIQAGEDRDWETDPLDRRGAWRQWAAWSLAAAAVLLLAAGLLWHWPFLGGPEPDSGPGPVAVMPHQVVSGRILIDGAEARTVPSGAAFTVAHPEPAILDLPDGSRAQFQPASQAILHGPEAGTRQLVELLEGTASFQVEPGEGPFQVETRLGRVTVLGTRFAVQLLERDRWAVAVSVGLVQVECAEKTYVLAAGEDRTFAPEQAAERGRLLHIKGMLRTVEPSQVTLRTGGDRFIDRTFPLAPDVQVLIDGKPAPMRGLKKGTLVILQRRETEENVVSIRAEGPSVGGEVRSLDPQMRTITLSGRPGEGKKVNDRSYLVAPDAKVSIDGKPALLTDIAPGAKLMLKLSVDGTTVVAIVSGGRKEGRERK